MLVLFFDCRYFSLKPLGRVIDKRFKTDKDCNDFLLKL